MKDKKKIIGKNQSTRDEITSDSCEDMAFKISELLDVMETKFVTNIEETVENRMCIGSILDSMKNAIERIGKVDMLIGGKHKEPGWKQTQKISRFLNYNILLGRIEKIREYHE